MQNTFLRLHFEYFFRRFQKSKNIARIMSHSVTIWHNVYVASFFAPDNDSDVDKFDYFAMKGYNI